ncbi:MAG: hypothetical protein ABIL18_08675 [candidate division WOR-3 bacterium]
MPIIIYIFFLTGYIYEDNDSLIVENDSLVICGNHHYNLKVHLSNGARLKISFWNGIDSTGKLILWAPYIYCHGSMIEGTGSGYSGGTNTHPDGYGPGCGYAGISGGGGGGAYGGAGGEGGDVNPGSGGVPYGNTIDTIVNMGSGGGAGRLGAVDGFGGNGGGLISLLGNKIVIDSSLIQADGMRGNDGSYEAGGGGSGGGIKIQSDTLRIRNTSIFAKGGNGGDGEGGGGGGAGGGRIKFFFTILDTNNINLSAGGGNGGYGGYGNGEDGTAGTIYFGSLVTAEEKILINYLDFSLKPIITNGKFIISFKDNCKVLLIYDIRGCLVKSLKVNKEVDVGDLRSGIYFLRIPDEYRLIKFILIK